MLISEIGLVLLLFIVGLEMDLQKLRSVGRAVVLTGSLQFVICAALGTAFAWSVGFPLGERRLDAAYVAVALALSSTMIVVKLLYEKHELTTFPGRITLGVLVFQDVWAILVLAVQPTLLDPSVSVLALSLAKGCALVAASWLGLSREMGALIAGVGMSTFPYNLDVIAKVVNIRDFFVPLFFVALGMQIPVPTATGLSLAAASALFLLASRLVSVFPILYGSASLLAAINLGQMSEFSLVIAAIGLSLGHVRAETVAVLTLTFALTSVGSTYLIERNHDLQEWLSRLLRRVGMSDPASSDAEPAPSGDADLVLLGFYQDASSIVHQLEAASGGADARRALLPRTLIIDFNPVVLEELRRRGIRSLYGDIASMDTLHHASLEGARVIACTLTDAILKGTSNARLLRQIRRLYPHALAVMCSDTLSGALQLYADGADFVFVPRIHSAHQMAEVLHTAVEEGLDVLRHEEMTALRERREILA